MTPVPIFTIIIAGRSHNKLLDQTISALNKQTCKSYEVIIILDKDIDSTQREQVIPAFKRNLGAKRAKGEILAFLDDDSYPDPLWLTNALTIFSTNAQTLALGGPSLTPPENNILQQASGLIYSSFLGSGGAGDYRNLIKPERYVDDYPTVNFFIRKKIFNQLGGFDTKHWPGEDTLLCRKLIKYQANSILYSPLPIVYHHRRPIGLSLLKQISRYGQHRGFFAKIYPENSLKLGYLIPPIFTLYILSLFFFHTKIYLTPLLAYASLVLVNFFLQIKNNLWANLVSNLFIPLVHLTYGLFFLKGFLFTKDLLSQPHTLNTKTGQYQGG